MSFYHAVFKITFKVSLPIREFVAQDEVRATGAWAPVETRSVRYLAPSEEVALAHFNKKHSHERGRVEYQFELVGVERFDLDACLILSVLS